MKLRTLYVACTILALGSAVVAQQASQAPGRPTERVIREVRHELLMLPYLGVFDNLAYKVDGYNVTLVGQVTRPTLKSDAENVVKRIEGVEHVDNQIEVLPPSPMDESFAVSFTAPSTATRHCRNMPWGSNNRSASLFGTEKSLLKAWLTTKATRTSPIFEPTAFREFSPSPTTCRS
jgi:BON domain